MNATEFCRHVENTLGWVPRPVEPEWRTYVPEAGRVNRMIKTNPALYSWDNLVLTVAYLKARRRTVRPSWVGRYVEEALARAGDRELVTSDLTGRVHLAIMQAMVAGEPDWVERLARATGAARLDVLAGWEANHAHA